MLGRLIDILTPAGTPDREGPGTPHPNPIGASGERPEGPYPGPDPVQDIARDSVKQPVQGPVLNPVPECVPVPGQPSVADSAADYDQWGVLDYNQLADTEWHLPPVPGQPVICDAQGRLLPRCPTPDEMAERFVGWLQSHPWTHGTPIAAKWIEMEVYPKFCRVLWGGRPPVPYSKVAQAIRDCKLMPDFRQNVNVDGKRKKPTMYVVPDPNVAANVVELAERKRA